MKWSELPQEYRDLEIPEVAKKGNLIAEDIDKRLWWKVTNEGYNFWNKCHLAKTIAELPPLPEKMKWSKDVYPKGWVDERQKENSFYMIYVDGQTGSNFKHMTFDSAQKEAERLSNNTSKKVYILNPIISLQREVIIRKELL